jgi:transposase
MSVVSKPTLITSKEDAVSAPSIAPYYPFTGVQPVAQVVTETSAGMQALITLEAAEGAWPACSECGQLSFLVHSYGRRRVRDLNLGPARVWLEVPQRKLRCAHCGIRVEALAFVEPHRRFTKRFERAVAELCRVLPIEHVASHFGLSWHTVKEIDRRRLDREVGTPCYDGLRLLAIDEIAVRKGHRYLTIVLNLESGGVVWVGDDRSEHTLAAFFSELTPTQLRGIEAIAADMSPPFWKGVRLWCPHAALVYDFFHVVAKYGREVIDVIRAQQVQQHTGDDRKYLKGSRYLLLRNARDLEPDQREQLQALLAVNEPLSIAYLLKDQLKKIWTYRREGWAQRALLQWAALAFDSGLQPLIRFAKGLLRHADGILNHCQYPVHTGRLEGINNKIKVIKRQAYGFRDQAYFKLKIKAAFQPCLQLNRR